MAIAENAATPAVVRSAVNATTPQVLSTGAFSPPAGCLLVAILNNNIWYDATAGTFAVSDSAAGSWTSAVNVVGLHRCHTSIWFSYRATAPGSITVSGDRGDVVNSDTQFTVRVLTGAAATQTGAGTKSYASPGGSTPANATQQSITTTTTGSVVYAGLVFNSVDVLTVNGATTSIDNWLESSVWCNLAAAKSSAVTSSPGAVTIGYTDQGANYELVMALLEILPAGAAAIPAQQVPHYSNVARDRAALW